MKTRTVTQYSCDFCNKKKYSKRAIIIHEKHCTMNPDRECRFCIKSEGDSPNLREFLDMVPDQVMGKREVPYYLAGFEYVENEDDQTAALDLVRNKINNCPACILAIIRQKKMTHYDFNFKEKAVEFLKEHNDHSCYE